ncbi:AI-2E family transporter [Parasedimentitalea psychrophila]|uniref:AI-2E family transporter n=1 Tax=Parasedimentitalea psychrophila TaxID=2997337 RepID=A0A9Y2L3G6_9RHOB|nr:AI-2E family transporter [Parasedimentitalea psychrophila]WIY27613.1 AI-2E family transporter [Parasedimentitalea psychrophila]
MTFGLAFWHRLVVVVFFTVAGLVLAADVLAPLSVALLLFVLLTAIIDRIGKIDIGGRQVPGWLAHVLGIALVLFGLLGILSILSNQAGDVAAALPRYEERFASIASRVIALVGDTNYAAAQSALSDLNIADFASGLLSSAGTFLSAFFLVLLYIPFMMLERGPMRAKIELASPDEGFSANLRRVLRSISLSLQRYMGIKTSVSLLTGMGSYAIMRPVGLDFAETWAVLAFALNFIPTIGSIMAVALPSLVALVQFETFTPFLIIVAGCGGVQFVVGNILEPSLTGRSLNLSPLMVVLALTFWTAIWGITGAWLSVPITVCALIVMSHIPATQSLAILMSGDGKLLQSTSEDADNQPGKPLHQTGAAPTPAQGE